MRLIFAALLAMTVFSPRSGRAEERYGVSILRGVSAQSNLDSLGEIVMRPLLIYRDLVYIVHPECWPREAGAGSNSRDGGAGNNDRNAAAAGNNRDAAGDANSRSRDGDDNDRAASGGRNDRDDAAANNHRAADGAANDRRARGDANARQAGGGALRFHCSSDAKGILHIYFENSKPENSTRIFYKHRYYTAKSRSFKIHTL